MDSDVERYGKPPFWDSKEAYDMDKTTKELTFEIHQALFGVANTEDNGLVGDFREFKREISEGLQSQTGRVRKLSNRVYWLYGIVSASILTGGGIGIARFFG